MAHVEARSRALLTNARPPGAFRGFGVPQAAIAHEALMDDLALRLGIDRLRFRLQNALRAGDRTATGQRLEASVGLAACLEALEPRWQKLLDKGVYGSVTEIAEAEKISKSYVSRILRLALLAPDLVEVILGGWADQRVMLEQLEGPLPPNWQHQRALLKSEQVRLS